MYFVMDKSHNAQEYIQMEGLRCILHTAFPPFLILSFIY